MKKIIKYAFLAFLAAVAVGCAKSEFEEITELPLTRCLIPMDLDATVTNGDEVTFIWTVTKDAASYLLEISENESFSGAEQITVDPINVPYTVKLSADKTYYWRVLGKNEKLDDSKWAVAGEPVNTSAVRDGLNPFVVSRTTDAITLGWDDAADKADLTSVWAEPVVMKEGESRLVVALTADEIAACSKTVEGLDPGREYKLTLIFGKAGQRGYVTACTRPDMGEGVITVTTAAELINATDKAGAPVRVMIDYSENGIELKGAYPDPNNEFITVNGDLYIYGNSTADGKKPAVKYVNFKLAEGAKVIHFEDVTFDGEGVGSLVDNDSAALTAFELINCELTGFGKGFYSVADSKGTTGCENFLVDGCYMHDINADGKVGGDFLDVRAGNTGSIILRNSTFYAVARSFIRLTNNAKVGSVLLENNTFNYVTTTPSSSNNRGIFSVSKTTDVTSVQAIRNVFLNMVNDAEAGKEAKDCWIRLSRSSNDSFRPDCDGNIYFNVGKGFMFSTALDIANPDEAITNGAVFEAVAMKNALVLNEDPCVNSAAGKLYLTKAGAQIVSRKAGDPRWWNAVQPEVIREKELTPVATDFTWDFTEKTIYDTEELTVPTIIGNAKIYATEEVPANVVMSKGVDFSTAATLSGGVPAYSGVEILTIGYGAVKVVATSADGYGTLQVLAGGDRYSLLADGVEHTVLLGDLSGENSIYVVANSAITLKSVTWTKNLTPDETIVALATPKPTVNPTKMDEGTAEAISVTWPAVAHAEDYLVKWNGKDNIVTDPSFTISAEEAAALKVGEYSVFVTARPVATSSKYKASDAAEVTFTVNKVETGGEVTLTWNFSASDWVSQLESHFNAINTNQNDINFSYDGLTVNGGGKSMKYNVVANSSTYYIQPGGAGKATERFFSFEAPASGTLTVYASNTGASEDLTRLVAVQVGNAEVVTKPGGYNADNGAVAVEFDITVDEPTTVVIYPSGNGLRFYGFEFTYVESTPSVDYAWDFSASGWVAELESHFTAINTNQSDINFTYDGLTVNGGGKSMKYNVVANSSTYFIQPGGAGKATERFFSFVLPASSGTLTVYASNTGASEDLTRLVAVQVGSAEVVTKPGGYNADNGAVAVEFEISAAEESTVVIYPSGNGLRFYGMEYHGK